MATEADAARQPWGRDFWLFQAARFAIVVAMQMQSVAIGWLVYDLTRRPLELGYAGLALFLPFALGCLFSGDVVDRRERRTILLLCGTAFCVSSMVLWWLARRENLLLWQIFAVLAAIGIIRSFIGPASAAMLPKIVPRARFAAGVAWNSTTWQVAAIAGPALGGILYAAGSVTLVFGVCTVLFGLYLVLVACTTTRSRAEGAASEKMLERLLAGIRFVQKERLVMGAISLDLFAVLLGGAVALLPVYARDILHVDASGLGMLRSAPALGAAIMAVLLAYRPIRRQAGPKMLVAVALFGIATCVFGASRSFGLSLVALVLIGATDMVSVVVRQTLIQLATPDAMRGRVSAVNQVFIGASNELGEFESGLTAHWFGTVNAVLLGGTGTILVVLLWAKIFPGLRRADSLERDLGH